LSSIIWRRNQITSESDAGTCCALQNKLPAASGKKIQVFSTGKKLLRRTKKFPYDGGERARRYQSGADEKWFAPVHAAER
jgi:hypothetical protein